MPYKFTKGGIITETGANKIPLEYTKENLKQLLTEIINDTSQYSHQDLCNWCEMFYDSIYLRDNEVKQLNTDEVTEDVLVDIDTQWDLYLLNTFDHDKLQILDLSTVKLPSNWLTDWLTQISE